MTLVEIDAMMIDFINSQHDPKAPNPHSFYQWIRREKVRRMGGGEYIKTLVESGLWREYRVNGTLFPFWRHDIEVKNGEKDDLG